MGYLREADLLEDRRGGNRPYEFGALVLSPRGVWTPAWALAVLRFYGLVGTPRTNTEPMTPDDLLALLRELRGDRELRKVHVVSTLMSPDRQTRLLARHALKYWDETRP